MAPKIRQKNGPMQSWHEKTAAGLRISDGLLRITTRGDVSPRLIKPYRPTVKEGLAGSGESRAHGCGGSVSGFHGAGKLAGVADGAARPARPRQGGGADRVGDRAGVLACATGFGGAEV